MEAGNNLFFNGLFYAYIIAQNDYFEQLCEILLLPLFRAN